ncbi:MAG: DUF1232 domain-containing protein [Rhizobiales bacterium]|nr:DUF1232 domain-containing protein [Hyphomicrobiales bacterium]
MKVPTRGEQNFQENADQALAGSNLPQVIARNETRVQKGFWDKIARYARWIPFSEDVVAAYYCAFDKNTPFRVRGTLLAALAYFIMPADLIPDIILGLGFTDDAAVIATAIALARNYILPEHRLKARQALDGEELDGEEDAVPDQNSAA